MARVRASAARSWQAEQEGFRRALSVPDGQVPWCTTASLGCALLLAIDDASLPVRKNLCLYLTRPTVRAGAVLRPSPRDSGAPDDLAAHFYGTVLRDGGRFRMWYYACHWGRNPDWPPEVARQVARNDSELFPGPLCYAESDDGVTWSKPALRQVLFKGSSDNNALALPHGLVCGATVIKDQDDPDPARRYKMVYEFWPRASDPPLEGVGRDPTVARAVSPDGIGWTVLDCPFPYELIEHASFYRHAGLYIINAQSAEMRIPGEGGTRRGRQGFARFSHDFDHWVDGHVESFCLPEPREPGRRGVGYAYDQVHLGVGAASFGNVCVGLYGIWHNAPLAEQFNEISCDLGLVVSNNGLRFREPVKRHVYIAREDSPVTPIVGRHYNTILCQANGILNVGDETRIYHGRWRNVGMEPGQIKDCYAEVALATIPRDRWGGLGLFPHAEQGAVWSAPVALPEGGCELSLNADGAEGMVVEVADERFVLLPGYCGTGAGKAARHTAGGLDCPVCWPGGALGALGGRTVRFKVSLREGAGIPPRLYAVNLLRAGSG